MRRTSKSVRGIVTRAFAKQTRHAHLWVHHYFIGRTDYTLLAKHPVMLGRAGDTVEFEFVINDSTGKYGRKKYLNIVPETLRVVGLREQSESIHGYVYVLTNDSFHGLLKIGYTTGSPEERCRTLSGNTGVPTPFAVAWSTPVAGDAKLVEQLVHAELADCRHGKEFFRVELDAAVNVITSIRNGLYPEQSNCESTLQSHIESHAVAVETFQKENREEAARRAEQAAIKLADRIARLTPPSDWDTRPVVIESARIKLKLWLDIPAETSRTGTEIMDGRLTLEDARPWRVTAEWKGWIFWHNEWQSFSSREQAATFARELLHRCREPIPRTLLERQPGVS